MKKILVVFITLGLVFALTACGNTEEVVTNDYHIETLSDVDKCIEDVDALADETIETYIDNSIWFTYEGESYQMVIDQFNEETGKASIEVYDEDGNFVNEWSYDCSTGDFA